VDAQPREAGGLTEAELDEAAKIIAGDPEATPPAGVLCGLCGHDHRGFNCEGKRLYQFWAGRHEIKGRRVARNEPCPCGSGKKAKACCMLKGFCTLRKA
jgi:hypothetical protein